MGPNYRGDDKVGWFVAENSRRQHWKYARPRRISRTCQIDLEVIGGLRKLRFSLVSSIRMRFIFRPVGQNVSRDRSSDHSVIRWSMNNILISPIDRSQQVSDRFVRTRKEEERERVRRGEGESTTPASILKGTHLICRLVSRSLRVVLVDKKDVVPRLSLL